MLTTILLSAISPDELIVRSEEFLTLGSGWFAMEKAVLFRSLLTVVSVIVFGCTVLTVGRWIIGRCRQNYSLKLDLFAALFVPLMIFFTNTGILFALLPLRDGVPEKFSNWVLRIFYTAAIALAVWALCRMISVFNRRICSYAEREDSHLDKLAVSMFGNILKVSAVFCALLFVGQNIFGMNISALLAGAGVVGLSMALAAKDTVSNFFGTLVIVADAPFRIGDRIECQGISGIVREVGMRSSRIVLEDESVCSVPNSILTNAVLRRINPRNVIKRKFELAVTYSMTPDLIRRAQTILHEILDDLHGEDRPENRPHIYFSSFGESSLNITVIVWLKCTSFLEEERLTDEINMMILHRFNEENISFAYPTRTVLLNSSDPAEKS